MCFSCLCVQKFYEVKFSNDNVKKKNSFVFNRYIYFQKHGMIRLSA